MHLAARLDRQERRELVTCRRIREQMPAEFRAARQGAAAGSLPVPVMGHYAVEIFSGYPSLGARHAR